MRRHSDQASPVDLDQGTEAEPDSHLRAVRVLQPPRRLIVVGSLSLIAVLAAAAVLVPLALSPGDHPVSSEAALATESPSPDVSEEPTTFFPTFTPAPTGGQPTFREPTWPEETVDPHATAEPEWTPEPNPRPKIGGWPIVWESGVGVDVAPDGSVFLYEAWSGLWSLALDGSGKEKKVALTLPDGRHLKPLPFGYGEGGTMLATEILDWGTMLHWPDYTMLYAFNPDGTLRKGKWPLRFEGTGLQISLGSNGTFYASFSDSGPIVQLDADGYQIRTLPSSISWDCIAEMETRPDGTIFCPARLEGIYDGPSVRPDFYDSSFKKLSDNSAPLWDYFEYGGDGTVVAFRYATNDLKQPNELAVLGTDGKPMAGWPVKINGSVSPPTMDADGTIYLVVSGSATQAATILAYRPDGQLKPWKYTFPQGTEPRGADAPGVPPPASVVLGREGTVYVTADKGSQEYVFAIGPDATLLPGWPVALPEEILVPGYCPTDCPRFAPDVYYWPPRFVIPSTGKGRLYIGTPKHMIVLGEDGKAAPGWPKMGDLRSFWIMPDGGVLTLTEPQSSTPQGSTRSYRLTRWLPDGTMAN